MRCPAWIESDRLLEVCDAGGVVAGLCQRRSQERVRLRVCRELGQHALQNLDGCLRLAQVHLLAGLRLGLHRIHTKSLKRDENLTTESTAFLREERIRS